MQFIMRALARYIASRPKQVDWLLERAKRTPYSHIQGRNTDELYMRRWWLFNPYQNADGSYTKRNWFMRLLPSIRIHEILLPDDDQHLHDHPWDAQTIILRGGYVEQLPALNFKDRFVKRSAGDTNAIRFGEYHRITFIDGVAVTLFITFKYRGTWGFLVDGKKVPYQQYFESLKR